MYNYSEQDLLIFQIRDELEKIHGCAGYNRRSHSVHFYINHQRVARVEYEQLSEYKTLLKKWLEK